jgi:hypothetical protein
LSAVISTVCLGLLIEAPEDVMYYWSMRAWTELAMISLVTVTTIFWVCSFCNELSQSIDVGIYVGIGFSLLLLVKAAGNYSMKPLKTDPLTGSFVPVDDLQYQVSPPHPPLKLVLSIRANGQNCYGQSDICQYR